MPIDRRPFGLTAELVKTTIRDTGKQEVWIDGTARNGKGTVYYAHILRLIEHSTLIDQGSVGVGTLADQNCLSKRMIMIHMSPSIHRRISDFQL